MQIIGRYLPLLSENLQRRYRNLLLAKRAVNLFLLLMFDACIAAMLLGHE